MANYSKRMMMMMLIAFLVLSISMSMVSAKPSFIPAEYSELDEWIARNMRDFQAGKERINPGNDAEFGGLDKQLIEAELGAKVVRVRKDGTGDFRTVTEAVNSVPSGNKQRVVLWIGGGVYHEKITVDRTKPYLTFYGDEKNMPSLSFDGTASKYGTVYSATVAVESDYFVAANIAFVNTAPMPEDGSDGSQAVAMRISGEKAAFHNCKFIGFQDTLCDDKGRHFFRDCYIRGTVDFIFGNGKSLYLNTTIESVAKRMGAITAHARTQVSEDSGFTFIHCNITGTGDTYLGRAWKEMPRVVFIYTYMGTLINAEGWSDFMHPERAKTAFYGEYKCKGPGAETSGRVKYAKALTDDQVKPFMSMTYIQGNKWLLRPPKLH